MFKKTTLPTGLRVITIPMKGMTTATVLVMVNTGSNNETKKINGISHFLEHMFFKGTKNRPTAQIIASEIDEMGGRTNAFTGNENTGYYIKVPEQKFNQALELLADIYKNSLLDEEEVNRERGVIFQELRMIRDDPKRYIHDLYCDLLYGDQPAGWDVIGTPETLKDMKAGDLKEYFYNQYTVDDTFVVVSGNIDEDAALYKIAELFSDIRKGKTRPRPDIAENQSAPASLVSFRETDQTHILVGVRAFGVNQESKRMPASVLTHVLGGSMASRIFNEIREKRGLAYAVFSSLDIDSTYGSFMTYAGVEHNNTEKVIELICKEYAKVRDGELSEAEINRSKESMKGRLALSLEGSDDLAFYVGGEEILTGKPLTPEEVYSKIDKVTGEDVIKIADEIFRPERLNLAIIGPHKDKKEFEKILKL